MDYFNPLHIAGLFLYPLKTWEENLKFFYIFKEYRKKISGIERVNCLHAETLPRVKDNKLSYWLSVLRHAKIRCTLLKVVLMSSCPHYFCSYFYF